MKRDVKMWCCGWCGKMCFLYSNAEKPEHCPYGLPGSDFSPIGHGVSEIAVAKPKSPEVADISDVFVEGDNTPNLQGDVPGTPAPGEHFVYGGEFVFEGKTFKFPKFYPGIAASAREKGTAALCGAIIDRCSRIYCEDCLLCSNCGYKQQKERAFDAFIGGLMNHYGTPLIDDVIPAGVHHPAFMVKEAVNQYNIANGGCWCGGVSCSALRQDTPGCPDCLLCSNTGDASKKISDFEARLTSYGIEFKSRIGGEK
ncbi:MAG: hypothetical protein AB7F40_04550 [Victivallaceae bacterium]